MMLLVKRRDGVRGQVALQRRKIIPDPHKSSQQTLET